MIGLLTALELSADWRLATLSAPEEQEIAGQEGRILRFIDKLGNIKVKLEQSTVSYILRQAQENITRPGNRIPCQWTGYSFRVGAAVDLVESGYTIEQVMRKGDWKSVQAGLRYVMAD